MARGDRLPLFLAVEPFFRRLEESRGALLAAPLLLVFSSLAARAMLFPSRSSAVPRPDSLLPEPIRPPFAPAPAFADALVLVPTCPASGWLVQGESLPAGSLAAAEASLGFASLSDPAMSHPMQFKAMDTSNCEDRRQRTDHMALSHGLETSQHWDRVPLGMANCRGAEPLAGSWRATGYLLQIGRHQTTMQLAFCSLIRLHGRVALRRTDTRSVARKGRFAEALWSQSYFWPLYTHQPIFIHRAFSHQCIVENHD